MPERGSSHGLIDNFYLSKEELLHDSPSRRAGVDADTEAQLRSFGCQRIQLGVLYLKLPQVVAATGQVLLHRFYCKQSMTDYDVKRVAIAATWLASKLEEAPKKFRDVLMVFARIDSRAEDRTSELLDPNSQRFEHLKQDVFRVEKSMLRAFGFVTHVEHPHKFVLSLISILDMPELLQREAWNLTNDSLRTTLCVRFKSEVVACGIIFLAARRQQVVLPEQPGDAWWDLCSVSRADVLEVTSEVHSLYLQPPPVYVALGRAAHAPGASVPRVSSLAAAASPVSLPASPQGGPPAGSAGAAGEGSATMGQLPNGAEASGDATGGIGGASGGRSDSRGQATSAPEQAREAAPASGDCVRGCSRSTSEEAELPGCRPGSRSEDRSRVAEPNRSRAGDRPSAAGQEARCEQSRDYRDGRKDSRDRDRADSRGAADGRTGNGYREGRREDRDSRRDERRHDSRDRGRDAKRDSRDQSREGDRGEYDQKRSRPPLPAESDLGRKRSRLTPPEERRSSRAASQERRELGVPGTQGGRRPPLAAAVVHLAGNDAPARAAARSDGPGASERVSAKERLGHRPSSVGLPPPPERSSTAPLERNAPDSDRSGRGGEPIKFQSRGDGGKGGPQPAAGRDAARSKAQQVAPVPTHRP